MVLNKHKSLQEEPSGMSNPCNLSIFHINIQSLANKIDTIKLFLNEQPYDVLCFSEHWLKQENLNMIFFDHYELASCYCRSDHSHGGVAIFINSKIKFKPINIDRFSTCFHAEFCASEIINSNTVLVTLYRSSTNGNVKIFLDKFEELIDFLYLRYKHIIVMGDLNFDPSSDTAHARELCCIFKAYGLQYNITSATRIVKQGESCLDNIITNYDKNSYVTGLFNPDLSDHIGQYMIISLCKDPKSTPSVLSKRFITDKGIEVFRNNILNINWDNLNLLTSSQMATQIVNVLSSNVQKSFPVKKVKENKNKLNWFSDNLKQMRLLLRKKRLTFEATKSDQNWLLYKNYKKQYRNAIKSEKKLFFDNKIYMSQNKQKTVWMLVNSERNTIRRQNTVDLSPDVLNNFFVTVSEVISKSINTSDKLDFSDFLKGVSKPQSSFFMSPVIEIDVQEAICKLKASNCLDCYDMSSVILKDCLDLLVSTLTILANKCFEEGIFPDILKKTKIIPLHKKGDYNVPDNFRPIAIIPVLGKLLEILLKDKLVSYFENKSLFSKSQFGFRKGKSTINALVELINGVVEGLDDGRHTNALLCDLTKAFDCVPHDLLIKKLEYYGVRGKTLEFIKSYLTDRVQYVSIGGVNSQSRSVANGVPQGSILGPILFLIFINDLPSAIDAGRCILFADDTTVLASSKNIQDLDALNNIIKHKTSQWFSANKLKVNDAKSQTILFSSDKKAEKSEPVKLLGIMFDTFLTWLPQVEHVCRKMSPQIFALRQLKPFLSSNALKSVYYATVHSHLTYGVILWGNTHFAYKAFKLQKSAIRVLEGVPADSHCQPLFKKHKILPLPCLFILEVLCEIHKQKENFRTHADVHNYNTRNSSQLITLRSRIQQSSKNKLDIKIYNALDKKFITRKIKTMTMKMFRSFSRQFLADHCFYSIDSYMDYTTNT